MQLSALLAKTILLGVIIGMMFGWEIGIGVALFVGGAGFISTGNICLGIVLIIPAIVFFTTSYLRIHGKIGVNIKISGLKARYFSDRSVPNEYQFSGEIEAKTPVNATIRQVYLGIAINEQEQRADLMWSEDHFGRGYVLPSSHSTIRLLSFQLISAYPFESLPKQATVYLKTSEWEKEIPVDLKFEVNT